MLRHDRDGRPGERHAAGRRFVDHHAQRVQVGPEVQAAARESALDSCSAECHGSHLISLLRSEKAMIESPKSDSLGTSVEVKSTLAGLTSRWTTP